MLYFIKFVGRTRGSIGIFSKYEDVIEAKSSEDCLNKVLKNYELLSFEFIDVTQKGK